MREAISNIDVESENDIMAQIYKLVEDKTVILISHRLANVVAADNIYVLDKGTVAEYGKHEELIKLNGLYANLWNAQQSLENYRAGISSAFHYADCGPGIFCGKREDELTAIDVHTF